MGKDDKQRRKGNAQGASSSRAAELLQSSGVGINFLSLDNPELALSLGLNPGGSQGGETDELNELDSTIQVIFRKFSKREANTREKALKSYSDLVSEGFNKDALIKSAKHFVGIYNKLVFDPSTAVRTVASQTLSLLISSLKSQIAQDVILMLPYTIISTFDHITSVKKAASSLLTDCFDDQKREKIYSQLSSKVVEICLDILKRTHNAMAAQKFEDLETYSQRVDRVLSQALTALDGLLDSFEDMKKILKNLETEFDPKVKHKVSPQVQTRLLKCYLTLMKNGCLLDVLSSKVCGRIVQLMDSPHESVSQHAFSCYLFMSDVVGRGETKNFQLNDFVCVPVLRMVERKADHYKSLEHCLLPLVVVVIKNIGDEALLKDWLKTLLEAFFKGQMPEKIFLSWCIAFADVLQFLSKLYKIQKYEEQIADDIDEALLNFLEIYLKKETVELKESEEQLEDIAVSMVLNEIKETGQNQVEQLNCELTTLFLENIVKQPNFFKKLMDKRRGSEGLEDKNIVTQTKKFYATFFKAAIQHDLTPIWIIKRILVEKQLNFNDVNGPQLLNVLMLTLKKTSASDSVVLDAIKAVKTNYSLEASDILHNLALHKVSNLVEFIVYCGNGNLSIISSSDAAQVLQSYCDLLFEAPEMYNGNRMEKPLLAWFNNLGEDVVIQILEGLPDEFNFQLLIKLVLLTSKAEWSCPETMKALGESLIQHVSLLESFPDPEDSQEFDEFLAKYSVDISVLESEVNQRINDFASETFILKEWDNVTKNLKDLSSLISLIVPTSEDISNLASSSSADISAHVLAKEPLSGAFAFCDHSLDKSSDSEKLLQQIARSVIYLNINAKDLSKLAILHLTLTYINAVIYLDGLSYNSLRDIAFKFVKKSQKYFKNWTKEEVQELFQAVTTSFWNKPLPFAVTLSFKALESYLPELLQTSIDVKLQQQHRLAIHAAIDPEFTLDDEELIANRPLVPFIISLERQTKKLKEKKSNEDVAFILLAEVRESMEKQDADWLFTYTGDVDKDLLSSSVLRLSAVLVERIPDLPRELRDFILCGLITALQNFTSLTGFTQLSELNASLALEFFIHYDFSLTDRLNTLKLIIDKTGEDERQQNALAGHVQEWREFFGSSASTYALSWYMWTVMKRDRAQPNLSSFFNIQVAKTIRNATVELNLLELLKNPVDLFSQHLEDKTLLTNTQVFDCLVDSLFSNKLELQLCSVYLLQNLIIHHFTAKKELDEQLKQKLVLSAEGQVVEHEITKQEVEESKATLEYKLSKFFADLFARLHDGEDSNIPSSYIVWDLLIRTIMVLDPEQSAEFCAQIESETVSVILKDVTYNLPTNLTSNEIEELVKVRPDDAFSFWKDSFTFNNVKFNPKRLINSQNYALWLYYRSLEHLPALVRDWHKATQNKALNTFTVENISPLLINQELTKIGNLKTRAGFTVRSRIPTREIVARYQLEELALEMTIKLPVDFPLSQVTIEHDKRNVINKGMTHKLHLNLFAFVNTRNGSIMDGVLQWKKNVEKQTEGVEACSICMMTVSTRNYRLPDLKCRQCSNKFHADCMLKWLQKSTVPNCPLCRNEFY